MAAGPFPGMERPATRDKVFKWSAAPGDGNFRLAVPLSTRATPDRGQTEPATRAQIDESRSR
jgi:hypothetical protein